jgi:hypothetical protein
MTNTTNIVIPQILIDQAKGLHINISEVCRKALAVEVEKVEPRDTGALSAKTSAPAVASVKEDT